MTDDLQALQAETDAALAAAADLRAWDAIRIAVLGRNGKLTALLRDMGKIPADQKRERGAALNRLKDALTEAIEARRRALENAELDARIAAEGIDPTLPPRPRETGLIHPISRTIEEIAAIFGAMGCTIAEGPDVESDWYNFTALNIPPHHPARADQDTFYLPAPKSQPGQPAAAGAAHADLAGADPHHADAEAADPRDRDRPHLSRRPRRDALADVPPVRGAGDRPRPDARASEGHADRLPARVFRPCRNLPVRFRSSYFPFTEPSMEVDIGWNRRTGELGKGDDWLEILGSGMVHPRVLANCGIDPREWQGFAWGMGVERIAMLKHGITDLRPFFESDIRWLRHYGFSPLAPTMLHEGV